MQNIDKSKIEKQAKEILDKFAHALERVEKEAKEETFVDREEFERTERSLSSSDKSNDNLKQRILNNAPNHDDDFIIAEKGSWK